MIASGMICDVGNCPAPAQVHVLGLDFCYHHLNELKPQLVQYSPEHLASVGA